MISGSLENTRPNDSITALVTDRSTLLDELNSFKGRDIPEEKLIVLHSKVDDLVQTIRDQNDELSTRKLMAELPDGPTYALKGDETPVLIKERENLLKNLILAVVAPVVNSGANAYQAKFVYFGGARINAGPSHLALGSERDLACSNPDCIFRDNSFWFEDKKPPGTAIISIEKISDASNHKGQPVLFMFTLSPGTPLPQLHKDDVFSRSEDSEVLRLKPAFEGLLTKRFQQWMDTAGNRLRPVLMIQLKDNTFPSCDGLDFNFSSIRGSLQTQRDNAERATKDAVKAFDDYKARMDTLDQYRAEINKFQFSPKAADKLGNTAPYKRQGFSGGQFYDQVIVWVNCIIGNPDYARDILSPTAHSNNRLENLLKIPSKIRSYKAKKPELSEQIEAFAQDLEIRMPLQKYKDLIEDTLSEGELNKLGDAKKRADSILKEKEKALAQAPDHTQIKHLWIGGVSSVFSSPLPMIELVDAQSVASSDKNAHP